MSPMASKESTAPLISVIIPVYNVAPYLREALDSVVNQTYRSLQILVIDDGSTDGSGSICDEYSYRDPRIAVIHQPNRGVSCARNVGLDLATGDFIGFLDSDDAWHPEFAECMLKAIDNADVVECMRSYYHLTLDSPGQLRPTAKEGYYDRGQALHGLIYGKFTIGVYDKLYRRELWKEFRFPEGRFHEEYEVEYNIFYLMNKLYYLEQPLYLRRIRPGSTTQTFSRKMAEDWKQAHDNVVSFVKSHIPEVFDETHLNKSRQSRMAGMIEFYVKGAVNTRDLKAVCENTDPSKLNFRGWLAHQFIRHCPWLLKILYPIYQPLRLLVRKVFKV